MARRPGFTAVAVAAVAVAAVAVAAVAVATLGIGTNAALSPRVPARPV